MTIHNFYYYQNIHELMILFFLLIAHRNVKAFITHGGLMSMQESIFHGVPLLCIPIYGDQMLNVKRAVLGGYGVLLNLNNITKQSSLWALDKILHDTR